MNTSLIWLLIKPTHVMLYLAALGVVLWRWPVGRWCRAAVVLMIVICGVFPTAALLMRPLEGRFAFPTDLGTVDGIIVLAGSEQMTLSAVYGEPHLSGAGDRLTTFLMLAERFPAARLVHTGAGRSRFMSQSEVARDIILGTGVPPERVLFEDQSNNTCESARLTRDRVRPAPDERWLVVTSALHMPRSVACFRAVDWNVTPYPADFQRGPSVWAFDLVSNLEDLDLAVHEWLGLVYYWWRGYTRELLPG